MRPGRRSGQGPILVMAGPRSVSMETITPAPTNDHIHGGQDKSDNGPQLALESVSQGAWHCVAQHFENAAQCSAELPGRPILRPVGGIFRFILASVDMGMVCV